MSLDIYFTERKNVLCPHCGEIVKTEDVKIAGSSGRSWYPILESLGYYVPYDERTEENDWYGKDMILTADQAKEVYQHIKKDMFEFYQATEVMGLIAQAILNESQVVINANW